MQPLVSAMTAVLRALVAALKSLIRGKRMLLKAVLAALWLSPSGSQDQPASSPSLSPTPTSTTPDTSTSKDGKRDAAGGTGGTSGLQNNRKQEDQKQSIDAFLKEAELLFLEPVDNTEALRRLAGELKSQFRDRMQGSPACMLPSYNSQLPTGFESGQYLSLDVGGSTLRVALVELIGRKEKKTKTNGQGLGREAGRGDVYDEEEEDEKESESFSRIVRMRSFHITVEVKTLEGLAFFDWMAKRIFETILEDIPRDHSPESPILMGLAWSFPVQQTSLSSGLLQQMGKGFLASSGLINQDLGHLIASACRKIGLSVSLRAIVNDGSAALLSQAYQAPSTGHFGLILGTGFNVAAHMPCSSLGRDKFGERPDVWFEPTAHVVVNTEMGMFGHDILPLTKWDRTLNDGHPKPDFQPLEHLVAGMYLGELVRIAVVDAVKTAGLLNGVLPVGLEKEYSFDTETMSFIQGDTSPTLESATAHFNTTHPSSSPATTSDLLAIRSICIFISRRSAALVAACVFALWELRKEAEASLPLPLPLPPSPSLAVTQLPSPPSSSRSSLGTAVGDRTVVAYNGSVIERYPSYLQTCQGFLNTLLEDGDGDSSDLSVSKSEFAPVIDLVEAKESSLLGAAVALASA